METATLTFIGSYDNRTSVGTIAAPDAHKMAKRSRTGKPRTKSRSIEEIRDRAVMMGVKFELEGKVIYLTPSGTNEYRTTTKANAWAALDEISSEILATLSNDQVFAQAQAAKELLFA